MRRGGVRELAIVSLGSNIEPETYLPRAIDRLRALDLRAVSQAYLNPALGERPQPDFLNAAARLETSLDPHQLRQALRQAEAELGRVRTADKFAARTIDLDLLLLGDQIIDEPEFRLPDPDLLTLAHLAVPAAEVAPHAVHPATGETLRAIAARLLPGASLDMQPEISARLQSVLRQERLRQ